MITKITASPLKKGLVFNYAEYLCDDATDIPNLPTNIHKKRNDETCAIGSKALILDNKDIYILSNNNEWIYLKNLSASSDFGTVLL